MTDIKKINFSNSGKEIQDNELSKVTGGAKLPDNVSQIYYKDELVKDNNGWIYTIHSVFTWLENENTIIYNAYVYSIPDGCNTKLKIGSLVQIKESNLSSYYV